MPKIQWLDLPPQLRQHLFDRAKLDEALKEYRAAAEVPSDEGYPYALYKAAWFRFNQSAFAHAMNAKQLVPIHSVAWDDDTTGFSSIRQLTDGEPMVV